MGLKKLGKREIAYPWAVYDVEKVRMGHCRPKSNANKESKGPMNPKDENEVIGLGKSNEVSNSP